MFYFSLYGVVVSSVVSLIIYLTGRSFYFNNSNDIKLMNPAYGETHYIFRDLSIALLAGLLSFAGFIGITLITINDNNNFNFNNENSDHQTAQRDSNKIILKLIISRSFDIFLGYFFEFIINKVIPFNFWLNLIGSFGVVLSMASIPIYIIVYSKYSKSSDYYNLNSLLNNNYYYKI
jgi:hypothetical protein